MSDLPQASPLGLMFYEQWPICVSTKAVMPTQCSMPGQHPEMQTIYKSNSPSE
jgi:hypothetical protein